MGFICVVCILTLKIILNFGYFKCYLLKIQPIKSMALGLRITYFLQINKNSNFRNSKTVVHFLWMDKGFSYNYMTLAIPIWKELGK